MNSILSILMIQFLFSHKQFDAKHAVGSLNCGKELINPTGEQLEVSIGILRVLEP